MKAATAGTIALLAGNEFLMCELYTITLISGTILRYTDADIDITYLANTFTRMSPKISRDRTKLVVGIEVDTMKVTLCPATTDLLSGIPVSQFVSNGGFDAATVQVDRCFMPTYGDTSNGVVNIFTGDVSEVQFTRNEVILSISSDLQLLTTPLPRNIISPSCSHILFDSGCTKVKSTYLVSSSCNAGSTVSVINATLAQASTYFDNGTITFTSGPNAGVTRTIRSYLVGVITLALPLPNVPATGNTFSAYPGCDKTSATCNTKFANLVNFRGFPFVPTPEVSI